MSLKKLIIIFIGGMCAVTQIDANQIQHTVKYGINSGYVKTNYAEVSSEAKSGYSIGYQALMPLSKHTGISVGLEYTTVNTDYTMYEYTSSLETSWIEIPVLFHKTYSEKLSYSAGGYVGLLYDSTMSFDSQTFTTNQSDINFGLAVGVSYKLASNIALEGRYQLGLKNIDPSDTYSYDGDGNLSNVSRNEVKINILTANLAYMF